jgi:toxin-antitoxin system PIN domain toxin
MRASTRPVPRAASIGLDAAEPSARYRAGSATAADEAPLPARALLDVNVLIALLDADHLHHQRASAWLTENLASGWASCAVTQNGCVRIMSQPGYPGSLPTARVAERLRAATSTAHHRFIGDALSLLDGERFDTDQLLGHRQVTDAWLLGLAVAHGLRFVTFDGQVSMRVVRGARTQDLVVL